MKIGDKVWVRQELLYDYKKGTVREIIEADQYLVKVGGLVVRKSKEELVPRTTLWSKIKAFWKERS